jgi:hypothetical protein
MKNIIMFFLELFIIFSILACSKSKVELPELDFSSNKIYTPVELKNYKTSVGCSEKAYWEGKKINITGYVSKLNINIKDRSFFLYENADVVNPKAEFIGIYYNKSLDSLKISSLLLSKDNKKCIISLTCNSADLPDNNSCTKILISNIISFDDIKFE